MVFATSNNTVTASYLDDHVPSENSTVPEVPSQIFRKLI